jgi:hypothetical protein
MRATGWAVASEPSYLGLSADGWSVLFGALQALAVVVALAIAAYELRNLVKQRRAESMERVITEWRRSSDVIARVMHDMPMSEGTVRDRTTELARLIVERHEDPQLRATLMDAARVVEQLNDMGALVEVGAISQDSMFAQSHVRVIQLVTLLEPYVLLVSASEDVRWGLRIRRMERGARAYHQSRAMHAGRSVRVRGVVVVPPSDVHVPCKDGESYMPALASTVADDDHLLRDVLSDLEASDLDLAKLSAALVW